jgi:hypothetical protein
MSWIKDNKFLVALTGGTLISFVIIYAVGLRGANRYDAAKATFDEAYAEAQGYEKLPLYPKVENRNGKNKALGEYRKSLETLQEAFAKFRPKEMANVSPQEFTTLLKLNDSEVRKAFADAGTIVPDPFFMGFLNYKTSLAIPSTTGLLSYQMNAIKSILLELAKASPTEFRNLYRPALPEESGNVYVPLESSVSRGLPLEITFVGTEKSVRKFCSAIEKGKNYYVVIRTLRISNAKKEPPKTTDAKFDKPAATENNSSAASAFPSPGGEVAANSVQKSTAAELPKSDSSRILSQVLGDELVQVFVRLDVLEFLPVKKLPEF